jgi:hypothetical protein
VLSDQNFSPALPCNTGECLKIVRVENGSLSEIVNCFLELTRGKEIQAGSVIVLFSTAHLQLRGVAGYMADLSNELGRLASIYGGGGGGGWCAVGDFGVKIKKFLKIFRGSFRGAKFLTRMLSLFSRRFFS